MSDIDETLANGVAALALVEEVGRANDEALGVTGGGDEDQSDSSSSSSAAAAAAAAALPLPFQGAPGGASRRLVRSLLPLLMPLVLGEVREWTSAQRNGGARLLGTTLAFAQSAASSHLSAIINACNNAVSDEDKDTAERIVGAARVLGAYVPPVEWLPLSLETITGQGTVSTSPPPQLSKACRRRRDRRRLFFILNAGFKPSLRTNQRLNRTHATTCYTATCYTATSSNALRGAIRLDANVIVDERDWMTTTTTTTTTDDPAAGEKALPAHRAAALVIAAALLRAAPPGSLAGKGPSHSHHDYIFKKGARTSVSFSSSVFHR